MQVRDLKKLGIPSEAIKVWETFGISKLLPVQEAAFSSPHALQGGNLCIFSPTSTGKTFIAEVFAVRAFGRGTRSIILAPTRALAEELYLKFDSHLRPAGIRVRIATS